MTRDPSNHSVRRRLRLAILALLVTVVAAGCSMVSLGYRNLPILITYRVNQWFGLDEAQSALVKTRTQALHAWHRREGLASLVRDLDEAQDRLARPLTAADADWFVDQALAHYRAAAARLVSDSAPLLATLRPEQIGKLESHFATHNREFAEKHIDAAPNAVRNMRLERIEATAQDWLGPLSAAQRERLRAGAVAIPIDYPAVLGERLRRQRELLAILRGASESGAEPSPARSELRHGVEGLQRWVLDWETGRSQGYRRQTEAWIRGYKELYVELINDASPEQRQHLRERLGYYARELAAFVQPQQPRADSCDECRTRGHPG